MFARKRYGRGGWKSSCRSEGVARTSEGWAKDRIFLWSRVRVGLWGITRITLWVVAAAVVSFCIYVYKRCDARAATNFDRGISRDGRTFAGTKSTQTGRVTSRIRANAAALAMATRTPAAFSRYGRDAETMCLCDYVCACACRCVSVCLCVCVCVYLYVSVCVIASRQKRVSTAIDGFGQKKN